MKQKTRTTIAFYSMISPWLIIFLGLGLFPLLYGFYLSFTNYYGFNMNDLSFVGLRNYQLVFTDTDAMYALGRTLVFTLFSVPIGLVVAFMLAVMLNGSIKGLGIFRTIFYLPSLVPIFSAIVMWKLMFSGNGGILNTVIGWFGMPEINWLGYDYATVSLVIMMAWGAGGGILIYLAGLKGIPRDLYEASQIDGASGLQRFRKITLPLMTPVIFFNFITGIIGSLQVYLQPIMLNGTEMLSRPIQPNYLYAVHAFQQIFATQRFAYGMALLWVLFVVIMILSIVVFTTSKYWVYYETDQGR
ncbi:N-Acetyl-D-glucosamine ABC transport system, permease protein 1 [Paenibacillus pasadenensis]|uniref:N-Acetyl-D-glucosamine ABC transport system, permease protein 1 n=1 Tax=Paenibacillus pasadenensis TaxID=217090 RepID=A0A2N5N1L4_9BACL|nr:sugar ABC transporter permease [Paenibacillus pasadenensis]PLT44213.1 N-Acetyl-D-glucosamine ABC transport system, permease protein 1 [Paenibacillus pasadenensis]